MHKRITDVLLDGFSRSSAQAGEPVDIIVRDLTTSEDSKFYLYAEQIAGILFSKLEASSTDVDRYLLVLHEDATADVYLQHFQVQAQVRVSRAVEAGQALMRSDISTVESVQFPDAPIRKGDRIVYFDRRGWRFGVAFDFSRESEVEDIERLCGQLQAKLMLEDILQVTLAEFAQVEDDAIDAFVITEGKTDWRHFERAFQELGLKRRLRYDVSDQDRGDSKLLEICRALALEPRSRPVICVFDRDNESILKQLAKADPDDKGYQDWGNNVFSLALPVPEHRLEDQPISVEMLYADDVLARVTAEGRRLCFDNEVKKEVVQGRVMRAVLITPADGSDNTKRLVTSDVDTIEDETGRKAGLSKARFAELLRVKSAPFDDVDFAGFRRLADLINAILPAAAAGPP